MPGEPTASPAVQQASPKGLELMLTLVIKGVEGALPKGKVLELSGQNVTREELLTRLQQALVLFEAVRTQKRQLVGALKTRDESLLATRALLAQVEDGMVAILGRANPTLTRFGFRPQQPRRPLTSGQKVIKAEKARLTRLARHTVGPRQRLKIQSTQKPVMTYQWQGTSYTPEQWAARFKAPRAPAVEPLSDPTRPTTDGTKSDLP